MNVLILRDAALAAKADAATFAAEFPGSTDLGDWTSEASSKSLGELKRKLGLDDRCLQRPRVPVDGVLHDEGVAPLLNLGEVLKERSDVLRPEDDAINRFTPKVDAKHLLAVRVHRAA